MDKCREAFERHQADLTGTDYEELKAHFDSNEQYVGSRYNEGSLYERDWLVWEACWKSRQAEVEEKDKRIGDQKDFIEMALNSLNHLKENAVTHRDYGHECNWVRSFNDLIKLADDAEDALKQALRGDDDINVTR